MGKIFTISALLFILAIDIFLFLGQTAIININPDSNITYIDYDKTLINAYDTSGNYTLKGANASDLPNQDRDIAPETGETIFTDPITVIKNFFTDTLGLKYFVSMLGGPTSYMASWGLPIEFIFAIGAFWYGLTFFLVVSFLLGRE